MGLQDLIEDFNSSCSTWVGNVSSHSAYARAISLSRLSQKRQSSVPDPLRFKAPKQEAVCFKICNTRTPKLQQGIVGIALSPKQTFANLHHIPVKLNWLGTLP